MSSLYIVTGAAGMIGSNLIAGLNARGITNILAVDNLTKGDKFRNLVDCQIADYMDKHDFRDALNAGAFDGKVKAILHQGACSNTMEHNGQYMMDNNYRYTVTRKWKLILTGAGILIAISGTLYFLGRLISGTVNYEIIIIAGILIAGIAFAYYIYLKKAFALLVIYLFLAGSILYVNSVDFVFTNILKPHQKERVEEMLGIRSDPHGTGYNVNQSLISIGSGGLTGKGYLQGTQTKFKFVPAQSTDFIFCTVGEEWGYIGSAFVIILYTVLLLRLIVLAERQRSVFSRIYGYGVAAVLFTHFFINIGMATGLVPVIGIPLPFFSYGGSSLWGFTILLFIFLRLDAGRTEYLV